MVRDDQDRVSDPDNCPLVPALTIQPAILRSKIRVFRPNGGKRSRGFGRRSSGVAWTEDRRADDYPWGRGLHLTGPGLYSGSPRSIQARMIHLNRFLLAQTDSRPLEDRALVRPDAVEHGLVRLDGDPVPKDSRPIGCTGGDLRKARS